MSNKQINKSNDYLDRKHSIDLNLQKNKSSLNQPNISVKPFVLNSHR
jgi:hypothetical protein